MKTLTIYLTVWVMIFLSARGTSQETDRSRNDVQFSFPEKIENPLANPIPEGTYTVGNSGDFKTLDSALSRLSLDGIEGPVTFKLIDELYTAPSDTFGFLLIGPVQGAGPDSRVTIKPAANKNVTILGSGQDVITFVNTSYLTLDGIGVTGPTTLTIHALHEGQYYWNDCLDFINNCDYNIVQNINFISEDYMRLSSGVSFWREEGINNTPDRNLIQYNFIQKAGIGIYISAFNSTGEAIGNIIRYNKVGSLTDSLITWGIKLEKNRKSVIDNNIIQNLTQKVNCFITFGINSCVGNGCVISNNVVRNINSNNFYGSAGILLSGDGSTGGNKEMVYNNMIYDIKSASTYCDSRVAGIQLWHQSDPGIYFNSVYLYGEGTNSLGSAALYIYSLCTNVTAENNILVNNRDESPYCASSIYDYSPSNLTTDYNDLYCRRNQNGCLVKGGNTLYNSLNEWRGAGKDLNSIMEMPNFIEPFLHIDNTQITHLLSNALPISDIPYDFDGEMRDLTSPCIGADEFIITGIEDEITQPAGFLLNQNYPNPFNPTTKISWYSPEGSRQTLKVYDVLGNEIATLFDGYKPAGKHNVEFDASSVGSGLSSGVYLYRLKAGNFVETKKMILLR